MGVTHQKLCTSATLTPDNLTYQGVVGTPVLWTASATCAYQNPDFSFWVKPPGGAWTNVQAYGTTNSYNWVTTGLPAGSYDWILWVRDADGSGVNNWYEAFTGHSFTLTSGAPCTAAGISATPSSPGVRQNNINIKGTASTCTSPLYQFWLQPPGGFYSMVQDFSTNDTYAWPAAALTSGDYSFTVRVKDAGSPAAYDAYTQMYYTLLVGTACSGATLSPSVASPQNIATLTQPIVFTGGSSGCTSPLYEWWMQAPGQNYVKVQDFGGNTYSWNAAAASPGTYAFTVRVKQTGSASAYETFNADYYTLTYSQTTAPATASLSAGNHTECAVVSGAVKCWGYNSEGQVGNGSSGNFVSTPAAVTGITTASTVASGYDHNCAVLADGTAQCWGFNQWGQLGDGTQVDKTTPVTVSGLTNATQIAGGAAHTCARLGDSTLRCWGYNPQGALGNGTISSFFTPQTVTGINNALAVSAGYYHSCALLSTGQIQCWGGNSFGQLGDGTTNNSTSPVTVSGINNAVALSSQSGTNCALLTDKTVKCWGYNVHGELGNGGNTNASTPVTVQGLTSVTKISVFAESACAVNGTDIYCWGNNPEGELGNGNTTASNVPVIVAGLTGTPVSVAAGWRTSCAALADGTLNCWGYGLRGELGNAATASSLTPVLVSGIP